MNFCKMTRESPSICVVDVSIGSIGARKEKGAPPEMGEFWQRNARRSKGKST